MQIIIKPTKYDNKNLRRLGGKGKRLLELSHLGHPVPTWFAVTCEVFNGICRQRQLRMLVKEAQILDINKPTSLEAIAEQLQRTVYNSPVNKKIWQQIVTEYRKCFLPDEYVAVRSSASAEDSEDHSLAGQLESVLCVKGEEALMQAIRRCWASAFSVRALTYYKLNGLDLSYIRLAVIVQKMVPAKVSGVIFTMDPTTNKRDTLVISATYGLGSSLVSGLIEGDTYHVNKLNMSTKPSIGSKEKQILNSLGDYGAVESPVPPELRQIPCLTSKDIQGLTQIGIAIEQQFGSPQDIEWAIDSEGVHILQTRPITAMSPIKETQKIVWDNSNIIESYPGVTTPLTFSFARDAYSVVYTQAAQLVGVSKKVIKANSDAFGAMIGFINGRIYYNLNSWCQVLALLPGFKYNKLFMEQMMGVKEAIDWQTGERPPSSLQRLLELSKMLPMISRMLFHTFSVERKVAAFQTMVDSTCAEFEEKEFGNLSMTELIDNYHDLRQRLLWNWKAPIVNDFLTASFFGVLRKNISKYGMGEFGTLQNELLCGNGDILSTEPAKSMIRMAAIVRLNEDLLALFERKSDQDLCHLLLDNNKHNVLSSQIKQYLDLYGYRCVQELKLEQPTLKDEPLPLISIIRSYLKRPDLSLEALESRERSVRKTAEDKVRRKLKGSRPLFLAPRYMLFQWILGRTRKHIKYREDMRFARTHVFGLVRNIFNALGRKLQEAGQLDDARDVFYLEVSELIGFVRGIKPSPNLSNIAQSRKTKFQHFRELDPPPNRFVTYGVEQQEYCFPRKAEFKQNNANILRGQGCCPGLVSGVANVITSPREERIDKGEILVARETDPGWITLFPLASGLLIERGSILSHSAIVARELGIPTIVGINGLISTVRSGQHLKMDGAQGKLEIITEPLSAGC